MAKRRTKKDKSEAREKRVDISNNDLKLSLRFEESRDQIKSLESNILYDRELQLPLGVITADLTRTLLVTILALFLQIGLYAYFQNGGWEKLLPILAKVSL